MLISLILTSQRQIKVQPPFPAALLMMAAPFPLHSVASAGQDDGACTNASSRRDATDSALGISHGAGLQRADVGEAVTLMATAAVPSAV